MLCLTAAPVQSAAAGRELSRILGEKQSQWGPNGAKKKWSRT